MRRKLYAGICTALMADPYMAENLHQPYSGLQTRQIASLSTSDVEQIEAGRGWGLALSAELNGYPGPVHVLEPSDDLQLSSEQRSEIGRIFEEMRAEAAAAGADFIAAETALNEAFANGDIDHATLSELVASAAIARGNLRLVHLSRHLQTVEILNERQVMRYNALRGYTSDPCSAVPEGHNEAMWRRHNGCED